ncbi:MAG: adenylate/guanylate cyclase domain-containing protein [Lachnospiraceae bacterium]|nr:adenylate/guanylate cyclase domain-containing protein [Lachnospiraceae bacterium]
MGMSVWLVGHDRANMIANQRRINAEGSMQAICLLSSMHLEKAIAGVGDGSIYAPLPSLVIFDDDFLAAESDKPLDLVRESPALAGAPVFIAVPSRSIEVDEACYAKGAVVVVHKQLSRAEYLRVENAAWQYENTRRYEQELQRQAAELANAKEIYRLNTQLSARNELLHKVFGRYFSEDVVDVILDAPEKVSLGGEKRRATILVADLRGFTAICEQLDPEELSRLLNFYFGEMVDKILAYHGTVIEFLGDGILAVFGALLHDTSHQERDAYMAAITMQNVMREVDAFCKEHDFPKLSMGIGIHTGEVFVGNIGSEKLMRYNVAGSAVNICSRIESCTVGGQILSSGETLAGAGEEVDYSQMGEILVKGASEAICVYEIQGIGGETPCALARTRGQGSWTTLSSSVMLPIFRMDGKIILPEPVRTEVEAVSREQIWLRVLDEMGQAPGLFDNVVLGVALISEGEGREPVSDRMPSLRHASDSGWYAKVVARSRDSLVLSFTQMDDRAKDYLEQWVE